MTEVETPPERPTLSTTLHLLQSRERSATEIELLDLVEMAVVNHEPARTSRPECLSCGVDMPCDIWLYAEVEARMWLVSEARAAAIALNRRIRRYEEKGVK